MESTYIIAEIGLNHLGQYQEVIEYLNDLFDTEVAEKKADAVPKDAKTEAPVEVKA